MTPLTASTALTSWQFAPLVSAVLAGLFGLYLWCVARVRRRHPARPWPLARTLAFVTGLVITAIATQSSIGVYDDVLFSVHMVQHVLLIMVAPPFLVAGRPVTLLLHSWHNPMHSTVKRAVRSGPVTALTRPAVATILYCAVVVGTHTPPFMDLVLENEAVHDAEHALYLAAGCLFFLVVLGTEPLRHRVSALGAFLMLLVTMLADSGTGVVYTLQSREVFAPYARVARDWGPGLVTDLHTGGYIMFIGSDAVMSVIAVMLALRLLLPATGGMLPSDPRRQTHAESDASLGAYNEYLRKLALPADACQKAPPEKLRVRAEGEASARDSARVVHHRVDDLADHLGADPRFRAVGSDSGRGAQVHGGPAPG